MILSFADSGTEDVFDGKRSKRANKVCPNDLWNAAKRKLDWLDQAGALEDLRVPPGNRLEKLKGDRPDQHNIRINNQYRICFVWTPYGPTNVEIVDYH
jgi:proteic killer suppression protein